MMDFDNVLSLATQNRGDSSVQKRYSLQTGPPKKDPKSKGVSSAAIQALLKKQQVDNKLKVIERKKQKEELLAKRVENKTDRKARAMASRTKDNFHGYNGVPIVELPKKRRTKQEMEEARANSNTFRNNVGDPDDDVDDEDNFEYDPSESEEEQEPRQNTFNNGSFKIPIKQNAAPKSAAPLNFAALLKLAEKKQHEPVDLKPKIVKKEGRLRTADEIRELELERKAKKLDVKGERSSKDHSSSNSSKTTLEKNNRLQKSRPSGPVDKQMQRPEKNNKTNPPFKSSVNDRDKLNSSHKEKVRVKQHSSSSTSNESSSRPTHSQVSSKQMGTKPSSNHKTSASNDTGSKKDNSLPLKRKSVEPPDSRASSSTSLSHKNQSEKRESQRPGMNVNVKSNVLSKSGTSSSTKPGHPQPRPGGPPQPKSGVRPGASGVRAPSGGQSRPSNGGPAPGRAAGSDGAGTSKCTVISETISSKNMIGSKAGVPPRPGMPSQQRPGILQQQRPGMSQQRPGMLQQRPGMSQQQQQRPGMSQQRPGMSQQRPGMSQQQQRPGMAQQRPGMSQQQQRPGVSQQQQQRPGMPQQRPGMSQQQRPGMPPRPMNRPPGPMLPPITSAYKRKFEDEEDEYDSEMDDFIDDGDDDQDSISQHIKQIFGYDRNKYKDESDYALRYMESSWKDMQKEEARSLRMAVQEDLEEERKEEEEFKRQNAKKPRKK